MNVTQLIVIKSLLVYGMFAQIPNFSFENWSNSGYLVPDGWDNLNQKTASSNIFTCSRYNPGNPGSYFMALTSKTITGKGVVPGIAVCGKLDTVNYKPISGFSFSRRPAQLNYNMQYMVFDPNDKSYVIVCLTKWNSTLQKRDTIAYGKNQYSSMAMSWISISLNLNYYNGDSPDSACIVVSASENTPANNSYIYIDNLLFSGNVIGVEENNDNHYLVLFPNPLNHQFSLDLSGKIGQTIKVIVNDVKGELIMQDQRIIDTSLEDYILEPGINKGIYFIQVTLGSLTSRKKIIIQ